MGFHIRSIDLDRQKWIAETEVRRTARHSVHVPAEDAGQTAANGVGSTAPRQWHSGRYNALGQILRPQGWFPWAVEDENGTAFGVFALSADALHRHDWNGFVAFSPENLNPSWDVTYNYRKLLPELSLRSFRDVDEIGQLAGPNGSVFDGWLRNTGVELTARIPLTLGRNVYTTFLAPIAGFKSENIDLLARGRSSGVAGVEVQNDVANYRGLVAGVQFFTATQALRDVVPKKGLLFTALADWSSSYFKSQVKAQQYTGSLTVYFPALFKHHALQVQASFTTRGGRFGFDSFRSYPLGFGDPGQRKLLRLKTAYHFPIAYSEWQMPLLPVYFDYLAGTLFFDWGTSWNHGSGREVWSANDRSATGVVLGANVTLFQTITTRAGVALFYHDGDRELRVEPVIGINF